MKHASKRFLSILLSLVMALGLLPGMSLTALAYDGNPYASLVGNTTSVTFNGKPWYIIADNSTAVDAGTVTLLAADTSFGKSKFHDSSKAYSTSTVKDVLDALTAEGGDFAAVKDAIADTDLTDVGVSGAKLYLLSTSEAGPYANFNYTGATFGGWWLRSPASADGFAAFVAGQFSNVDSVGWGVNEEFGVRPALKLDLSKVTFDSESKTFSLAATGYAVTLSGGGNTTYSGGDMSQTVTQGQAMTTVTFTPVNGYHFEAYAGASQNGVTAVLSNGVITVSGTPTGDVAITIPAAVQDAPVTTTYTVSVVTGANGAAGVSPEEAAEGTLVEVTPITPFSGYELDKITLSYGGSEYDITEAKSFQMPAANVTVTVTFKPVGSSGGGGDEGGGVSGGGDYSGGGYYAAPRAYRVSLTSTAGGSAYLLLSSGESGTSMNVVPTSLIWVVATPDPGYKVESIVCVPGGDITNGPSFVMPYGNVTVTVTFKPAA